MIRWEDRADGRHILLEGELDHEACDVIGAEFHEALSGGTGTVVVDFHRVPFVSSKGIWLLLEARGRLKREGRQMLLRGLSEHVRKALDTVGVFKAAPEWEL